MWSSKPKPFWNDISSANKMLFLVDLPAQVEHLADISELASSLTGSRLIH